MSEERSPLRRFPWPLAVVAGLFLLAIGYGLKGFLSPPILVAFLFYLLLPYRRQAWVLRVLTIAFVVTLLWIVDRFGGILLILGFSLFLAYVLDPAADFLERHRVRRSLAVLTLIVPVVAVMTLGAILLLPPLIHQLGQLIGSIPDLAADIQVKVEALLQDSRFRPIYERYQDQLPKAFELAQEVLSRALSGVVDATRAVGAATAAAILIPIVSFYLLRDYDRLREKGSELVPRRYHRWFSECMGEMDHLLGRWLRGAAVVALIVGVTTGVGLAFLGVPYALLLGAMAGLLNFVPVVGFWISFVAAAVTALASAGWPALLKVSALYFGISILESQLLSPKIVGEAIGMHPVLMLVALVVFADLFGILGAFLSVPLAILLLILGRQLRSLYMASDIYSEERLDPPVG